MHIIIRIIMNNNYYYYYYVAGTSNSNYHGMCCNPCSAIFAQLVTVLTADLRSVSTTRVHGPSSRAELTARELGCIF